MLPWCKVWFRDIVGCIPVCMDSSMSFIWSKHKLDPPACLPAWLSPQLIPRCAAAMPSGQVERTRPTHLVWPLQGTMTTTSNQNTGRHTATSRRQALILSGHNTFFFSLDLHTFTVVFPPCTSFAHYYGNYSAFMAAGSYLLGPNASSLCITPQELRFSSWYFPCIIDQPQGLFRDMCSNSHFIHLLFFSHLYLNFCSCLYKSKGLKIEGSGRNAQN